MLFGYVDIDGEVVAEAALEIVANERTQRVALVLALLLEHVGAAEDAAVVLRLAHALDFQRTGRARGEVVRDDDVVEEVPGIAVGQRAVTRLEQRDEGVEHVARLHVGDFALGVQTLDDAVVRRVVVQVTHDDHLHLGTEHLDRVDNRAHLPCGGHAQRGRGLLAAQTRRPVAHQEEEGLRLDGSPHRDEVTRTEVGTARHVELDGLAALELEDVGAVEEAHIDTAGVGRVVVYDPVVAGGELRSGNHILHHRTVLDFRHADDNRVILVLSGDVEEHALQVADFARVLGRVPALRPLGRELLVEHVGVGNRIEQVLEVVEDHFIGLLRETGHEQHGKQSCKKNFLHHKAIEFDSIQVRISCIGCISC